MNNTLGQVENNTSFYVHEVFRSFLNKSIFVCGSLISILRRRKTLEREYEKIKAFNEH